MTASPPPQDIVAYALWKVRNHADPSQDALARHLMQQEIDTVRDDAHAVVEGVYREGYAIVSAELRRETLEEMLRSTVKLRDPDVVTAIADRLRELYQAALRGSERDLSHPMIQGVIKQALGKGGAAADAFEQRALERSVTTICADLAAAGYKLMPKNPPADAIENLLLSNRRSAVTLVFGDDPERIGALYKELVERQRIH